MPKLERSTALSMCPKERAQAVVEGERRILEMIATGVALPAVLGAIARLFEEQAEGVRASISIIEDGTTMRHGAAPSIPDAYAQEVDGLTIGLNRGSCGTAAFTRQRVIVEDIATDPIWAACNTLVLSLGLRACWSTPILDHTGEVIGTFGIYYLVPRGPSTEQLELADRASHLAAIAIERQRDDQRIRLLHEQLEGRIRERTEQLERAVAELIRAREAAEAASAAKTAFLANVSHEIRTPLNAVLGFAQLLAADADLPPKHAERVRDIQASGEHLLSLINGVLEMSKIESGHLALSKRRFDLSALLADVDRMFRLRAESKGLDFTVSTVIGTPRTIVADEGKLRQVLINLVCNAVKFTDRGSVQVRARSHAVDARHVRLTFEVVDTGPGISEAGQSQVFQPFVQVGDSAQQLGGTGLGLAICKRFVECMGGDIVLESRTGLGSTFRFELVVERAEEPASMPVVDAPPSAFAQASGTAILVVDDSELNRRLLKDILGPLGLTVLEAGNGREALDMYDRFRPELILMDLRMPVMDGYEAMRRIRSEYPDVRVRIVAVTASAFEEDVAEIISSGADDVVRKPFRTDKLLTTIARQIEQLTSAPGGVRR